MTESELPEMSIHYERPPIVEALINIQVAYADGFPPSLMEAVEKHFGPKFKFRNRIGGYNVTLAGPTPLATQQVSGVRFVNLENNRVLQIRHDGFAYSHLTPYTRWEALRDEAIPLWREFVDICRPLSAVRIAVKFINRLILPRTNADDVHLDHYLRFRPEVPKQFETVSGFMSQVQLPLPELAGQQPLALVTVASQPPTTPNTEAVVLDIDVFETVSWPPESPKIWDEIEKMRFIKNRIFESAIDEKFKEAFS